MNSSAFANLDTQVNHSGYVERRAMRKLSGIQYLRGCAAVMVVLDHIRGMAAMPSYAALDPAPWLQYGAVGVDVFFTISGFIMMVSCFEKLTLRPKLDVKQFFQHRFARIIPFLWACVVVFAAVRWFGKGAFELAPYLRSMALWPVGEVRPNVVWTLRHEALFYAVFAIAMLRMRRPALLVLWCLSPLAIAPFEPHANSLAAFLFNPVNLEFGAGTVIGALYLREGRIFQWTTRQTFLCSVGLSALAFALAAEWHLGGRGLEHVAVLALLSSCLTFFCCLHSEDPPWLARFGIAVGDASYAIYLTHTLVVLALLEAMRRIHPHLDIRAVYAVLTLSCLGVGYATHRAIEQPLVRAARIVFGLVHAARSPAEISRQNA